LEDEPPSIIAWEIFISEKDKENTVGLTNEQDALVIEIEGLEKSFPPSEKNSGPSLNLAAGKQHLLLNYFNFDHVKSMLICGFDKSTDIFKRRCVRNE